MFSMMARLAQPYDFQRLIIVGMVGLAIWGTAVAAWLTDKLTHLNRVIGRKPYCHFAPFLFARLIGASICSLVCVPTWSAINLGWGRRDLMAGAAKSNTPPKERVLLSLFAPISVSAITAVVVVLSGLCTTADARVPFVIYGMTRTPLLTVNIDARSADTTTSYRWA